MTLTTLYVAAVAVGIAWVIFRLVAYLRAERERERRISTEMMTDDKFKDYLKDLKTQSENRECREDRGCNTE